MTQYDPGSQEERAAIMKDEARAKLRPGDRPPTTYNEIGNRPSDVQPKAEASPLKYPALPASSPWAGDPTGTEPLIDGSGEGDVLTKRKAG
jgi:hypothetical protein